MVQDLCARLAYMSDVNLAALEEQAAASPSGKDHDRFPIANKMLEWAAVIQLPDESNSPMIRAVFAHDLGKGSEGMSTCSFKACGSVFGLKTVDMQ